MRKSAFLFILALVIILAGCAKTNTLVLSGTIEATQVDIQSETNGKIINVLKDEGSLINTGDIIATVDSGSAQLQVESAKAILKMAVAKLDELKIGTRSEQIRQAEAAVKQNKAKLDELRKGSRSEEIKRTQAEYEKAKNNITYAQSGYDYALDTQVRLKKLEQNGGASKQQIDDAQHQLNIASQQLQNANDQLTIISAQLELIKNGASSESIRSAEAVYEQAVAQLDLLRSGATGQAIKAAEANVEQAQAAVDIALLQLEKYSILSPIDGILLYKTVDIGQVISPGTVIGTVQATNDYWIKIYLPQKHNEKAMLNTKVKITSPSIPNETIEGTIIFKSPKAEFTPRNIETTEAKEENTVIALKAKIDSHIERLSAGMTANVYID